MARTGGAQVFFDVLATFNAKRLLQDTKTVNTMMKAAYLDTLNTLTGEFQALGQMVTEFTDEVIASSRAFEEARIDFEKFVSVSEEMETILPSMVEDVVKIGEGFAFTGEEALKAASRMAQMGAVIGKSTIGIGTEIGVMFGLISGMETDAAMRRLTNLMQQTGFHMATNLEKTTKLTTAQFNMLSAIEKENIFRENSIDVLNQLNTVENRSIATMEQLTYTMNQFASQASLTGSSIAEMAAMSATLIEAGEQQGAAGRALRMMYARLGGDIAGAREEMEAMGIEVLDQEGNMKTLHQIMVDLNEKGFHELTGVQQQNIAQTISGNRHYVRFIKLMENLHRVTELTQGALFDFDSAQDEVNRRLEENAVVLEKLEAQLENVSAQMGNALLPGMIEGKEITLAWNRELEKFASGNYGEQYANLANSILTFKEVGAILMPFIQLQIAVRGITVAFGTMRSVLAAMLGQQIALNRQYHGATSLMDIQNATTEEQRRLHTQILDTQGQINTKKMFASEIEESIKLVNQINAEVLDRQLLAQLKINEEARKEFIQRQLVATREQQLLDLGSKVEGSMKRRLLIFQNHVEMAERLNRSEQARLRPQDAAGRFVAGTTGLMSPEIARRNIVAGMKDLEMLTKRISAQKDIATASERTLNSLQAQLVTSGRLKTNQDGKWHLVNKELNEQEKLYLKERERMVNAKHRLRDLKKIEYHVKGELMHLDTIVKKQSTYTKMIEEVVADHEKLSALLEKEVLSTQDMLMLEEMLSVYLDEEVVKLEKNEEALREQIKLLQQKMLEQKKGLAVGRKLEEQQRKETEKQVQAHLIIGTAMSRTFSSASMLLPVLGSMTGNTGLMRAGMISMNLSMISMLGPLMKGAGETLQMAFSMQKVADATAAAAISSARMKVGLTAAGVAAGAVLVYFLDQAAQKAEKFQKSITKVTSETNKMYGVMESLQTQEFLIANEDLAKIFDVQGIKVRDLANDYDLAKKVQSDFASAVSDSGRFMQRANSELINDTKTSLDMIVSLHESAMGKLESSMFRIQAITTRTAIMAAKPTFFDEMVIGAETLLEAVTFSEDRAKRLDMMRFLGFTTENTNSLNAIIASIGEQSVDMSEAIDRSMKLIEEGYRFSTESLDVIEEMTNVAGLASMMKQYQDLLDLASEDSKTFLQNIGGIGTATQETGEGINVLADDVKNLTEEIYNFSGAREELFFGGKYGNVTGSLYRQVMQQGVGTLYHKNEVIMSNNFHGFFNEEEAATRIIDILNDYFAER